jgi:hypothetical protein
MFSIGLVHDHLYDSAEQDRLRPYWEAGCKLGDYGYSSYLFFVAIISASEAIFRDAADDANSRIANH